MSEHNQIMAQRLWDLSDAATPGTKAYRQRLRDQAAVALYPGLWREGIAQDAVILADALVAALYPEEGEVEEAPTLDRHGADRSRWVGLWDAINRYSEACGGSPSAISSARMDAVAGVERALDAILSEKPTPHPPRKRGRRERSHQGNRV